ncbi:MAG TPA: CDGSH iron-sulfur domain-containing protein [Acidimicrobiales bacterium]|nr:CDGSH iron-sulfur domain-containing protein [Acidimicrobiales bacterium]
MDRPTVTEDEEDNMNPAPDMKITVTENGPYLVEGSIPMARQTIVADEEGNSTGWRRGDDFETKPKCALCRCGQSSKKPYCDSSHLRVGFDGTEVASRRPYVEQANEQQGPTLILSDAQPLCAFARFCDVAGQIWNLVEQDGLEAARLTAEEAALCPSGRLVVRDRRSGRALEPEFEPSIGIVNDPTEGVGGPIWVRGGIPITSADGETYEVRNRVTLCRCGASKNKPFCDASHASIGFTE